MGKTTSFVQGLTEVSATPKQALGTIRDEGDKVYKYVQYNDGAAVSAVAGWMCYYLATTGAKEDVVTCDVSGADPGAIAAGQILTAMTDLQYGWIQIEGVSAACPIDCNGAAAIGQGMSGYDSATDGGLSVATEADPICGIMLDTTTTAQIYLLCCPR